MSKVLARTYKKYEVQRSIGGRQVLKNEDGGPVLGRVIKSNIRITPYTADMLNDGWDSIEKPIAFYYMADEEAEQKRLEAEELAKQEAEAEKEAMKKKLMEELKDELREEVKKELGSSDKDAEKEKRKALFAKAKELGLNAAKNIKTDELEQLIEKEQ
jgi:ABC-type nitrate/sulfonate/bicarbonate transport system substrate-binding protein